MAATNLPCTQSGSRMMPVRSWIVGLGLNLVSTLITGADKAARQTLLNSVLKKWSVAGLDDVILPNKGKARKGSSR